MWIYFKTLINVRNEKIDTQHMFSYNLPFGKICLTRAHNKLAG